MTVTSTVPGPAAEVSCAYRRFTPPIDRIAMSSAVERIIDASLCPTRHSGREVQGQCLDHESRKTQGKPALHGIGGLAAASEHRQVACLCPLGSDVQAARARALA